MDDRLLLIDASGFIYRAYHVMPNLVRSDGQEVGAVVGYFAMLWNLLRSPPAHYTHIAAVFDEPRTPDTPPDWRRALYPAYKADRGEKPKPIWSQIEIVRRGTTNFGVMGLAAPGVEADDIIATYARRARAAGMEVIVVSHDKDLWQLIDEPHVRVYNAQPHRRAAGYRPAPHYIEREHIRDKFGVDNPHLIPDVQALAGDPADGYKGVPGMGPKIAATLVDRYGSLEGVLANIDDIATARVRDMLTAHADEARACKALATLHTGIDVHTPLEALRGRAPSSEEVLAFLDSMEIIELRGRVLAEWEELPIWMALQTMQREVDA